MTSRTCLNCKGPILRQSSRALYCSGTCKDTRNNAIKAARKGRASDA